VAIGFLEKIVRPVAWIGRADGQVDGIGGIDPPDQVIIPLEYPGQIFYKPTVAVGDAVRRNQIIGRSERGSCVHASISGTVVEIRSVWTWRSYNVPAVVIQRGEGEALTRDELFTSYGVPFDKANRVQRLRACGVICPWTTPGRFHLEDDLDRYPPIEQIVVKGVNEEPTVFIFEQILKAHPQRVRDGLRMLADMEPKAKLHLTVPRALTAWAKERFERVDVVGLPDDYQKRIERLVVPRIARREVPNVHPYRRHGIAVISVEYLLGMLDALRGGTPFVDKHVTVGGSHLAEAHTLRVPLGTTLAHVLAQRGLEKEPFHRLLVGGPLKGIAQYDVNTPLTKSAHAVYVMPEEEIPEEINLTCISCGRCTRVCPVSMQVHLVARYAEYGLIEEAQGYHPEACTDCGLCAYVCPAHRPLVQLLQMAKRVEAREGD
jgi:electron transport complex protein RnfC